MNPLERIIEKEDFARIVAELTPTQLSYARLRLVGLKDHEIAELCGHNGRATVSQTLLTAKRNIIRTHPDLAHYMTGRKKANRPRNPENRALDWDWLQERPATSEQTAALAGFGKPARAHAPED